MGRWAAKAAVWLAMVLTVADGRTVDQLSHRVRSAKDAIASTTKDVTEAAKSAAEAARSAAETAIAVKKAADEAGVTDALINAGKGAVKSGLDRITSAADDSRPHSSGAPASPKPPPAHVASEPAKAPSAPPPKVHKPPIRQHHAKRHPIHIDPAVMLGVCFSLIAILLVVAAVCSVRYCRLRKVLAKHNATTLASLQPIYVDAHGAEQHGHAPPPPTSGPNEDEGFEFVEAVPSGDATDGAGDEPPAGTAAS